MDVHHLTSFLHPFTNLEDLSLFDPRVFDPKPERSPKSLSAKGKINLEFRVNMVYGDRYFVYKSPLPHVAVHTITLSERNSPIPWTSGIGPCMMEINTLLAVSRETLTHLRVHVGKFSSSP